MLIDNQHIILSDVCMLIQLIYLNVDDQTLLIVIITSLYVSGMFLQIFSSYVKRDIFTQLFFSISYTLKIISQWITYQTHNEYMFLSLMPSQILFIIKNLKKFQNYHALIILQMALFVFQFEGIIQLNIKMILNLVQIFIFSIWFYRLKRITEPLPSQCNEEFQPKQSLAQLDLQVLSGSLKNRQYMYSQSTKRINFSNNSLVFDENFDLIEIHLNLQQILIHQSQSDQAFEIIQNLKLYQLIEQESQKIEFKQAIHMMDIDQQNLFLIEKNDFVKYENQVILIGCLCFEGNKCFQLQFFQLPLHHQQQNQLDDTLEIDMCRSLSHELGTNLNSIITFTKMALKDDRVETYTRANYLNAIKINCEQLNLIVGTIRDYNLINLKQFSLKLEELDIEQEIRFIVSLFADSSESKSVKIEYELDLQSTSLVNDKIRFRQVLFQLLQNAIKYSFQSSVTIKLINDNLECFISIIDNGIGLSEQEAENINNLLKSEKFIRVSEQSVGVGLGLGISNQLVKQMSGKNNSIQLTRKMKGCQFSFWIKNHQLEYSKEFMRKQSSNLVKRSSQTIRFLSMNTYFEDMVMGQQVQKYSAKKSLKQSIFHSQHLLIPSSQKMPINQNSDQKYVYEEESYTTIHPPVLKPKFQQAIVQCSLKSQCCSRVLIVDDEHFNIQCLKLLMMKFQSRCDSAFNGKEALQLVQNKRNSPCPNCGNRFYSLIFLDINMPVLDGYKTVQELKKLMQEQIINKAWCVANTGFCDLDTKIKSYDSGMDYFLTKPLDQQELKDVLGIMFPFDC